jgi:hypothetical protein
MVGWLVGWLVGKVFQRWIYHTMGLRLKKVVDRIGIVVAYWEEVLSVTDLGPGILSGTELATAAFCLRQYTGRPRTVGDRTPHCFQAGACAFWTEIPLTP